MTRKNILILVLILAIIFLVYFGFLTSVQIFNAPGASPVSITPPPLSQTVGWKSYQNQEYGFSIKYPKDWLIREPPFFPRTKGITLGDSGKDKVGFIYYDDVSQVGWMGSKQPTNFIEYVNDLTFQNMKKVNFVGLDAYMGIFTNEVINLSETIILLEKNGHIYELSYINEAGDELYKKIVSTFEFIK